MMSIRTRTAIGSQKLK